jgi:hypothetical protein
LGNTGQKRKSSALQNNMAEVAKNASESMVQQLKDMSDVNKSAEKEKLEVQMRLFSKQMTFLREKDNRLNEHAKAAQRNAQLAIEKQGDLIRCLVSISFVLGKGLGVAQQDAPTPPDNGTVGQAGVHPAAPNATPPSNTDTRDAI